MRTRVHIEVGPAGLRCHAEGALAVRQTAHAGSDRQPALPFDPGPAGPGGPTEGRLNPPIGFSVHLVGTAAGPMGGDVCDVRIVVRSGAHLSVRSAAATVVLSARTPTPTHLRLDATVEDAASLDVSVEPTVVTAGGWLRSIWRLSLAPSGSVRVTDRVRLGRHDEEPGRWSAEQHVVLGEIPVLRQRLGLGPGEPGWDRLDAPRALAAELRVGTPDNATVRPSTVRRGHRALCVPLTRDEQPVGTLAHALDDSLLAAERELQRVLTELP